MGSDHSLTLIATIASGKEERSSLPVACDRADISSRDPPLAHGIPRLLEIVSGEVGGMRNVTRPMNGILLKPLSVLAACALVAVAFAELLSLRRVPVRTARWDKDSASADEQ
jgi:hypothetical protein